MQNVNEKLRVHIRGNNAHTQTPSRATRLLGLLQNWQTQEHCESLKTLNSMATPSKQLELGHQPQLRVRRTTTSTGIFR